MKSIMRQRFYFYALIWAAPLLMAFTLLKQDSFASLEAFVIWLAFNGGAVSLAGVATAYLLENWAAWHNLPRWVKVLFPIALSGLLGVTAQAVISFDVLPSVPPAVQAILLWLINWISSQRAYKGIKDSDYGSSARKAAENG